MSLPEQARSFVTSRPVGIAMIFLAAVVFGALSINQLPVTLMPELTYPTLTVRTEYSGAAPEEVENDISRPVEEALGVVQGLKKISSISRAGVSDVVLEFSWDTDISDATQSVLEKLDLVFLPEDADRPLILHFDPELDPVLELSLSGSGQRFEGEAGLRRLRRLAELQIKKELEPLEGVAAVRVRGGLEEEIHVLLDEERLRRTNLSISQVIQRLAQENINVAGGTLQEGRTEYLVRTLNEYSDLDQIAETIVATVEGREVRVADLGQVEMAHKEREIITRTAGAESVQIDIYKEGDANIVSLAERVRAALGPFDAMAAMRARAEGSDADDTSNRRGGRERAASGVIEELWNNEDAVLALVADRSRFIESSIDDVLKTAGFGGLLAIFVLALFLRNARSTIIIALSIPISLLITFAPLSLLGVSLNIMSLGGLALGIGMLVDSSIVVLESIFRCREEGDGLIAAAERGTHEVRGAVFASTLTSIAVFLPMVFVEGIAGQAFGDLGLAVVVSLLSSVAVALYLMPMLASRGGIGVERPEIGATLKGLLRFRSPRASIERIGSVGKLLRWPRLPIWAWILYPVVWVAQLIAIVLGYFVVGVVVSLLHLLLEIVGKLIQLVVLLLSTLLFWAVIPAVGMALWVLLWIPRKVTDFSMGFLSKAYPRAIRGALASPMIVVGVVAICLFGTWQVVKSVESELLPEVNQGEFTVEVKLPVGTPLEETDRVVSPVEQAILTEAEKIQSLILTVGYDSANSNRSDEGEHTAQFKVLLADEARGAEAEQAMIERLRRKFSGIPDMETRVVRPVLFSQKTPIEVEVQGFDLDELRAFGDRVEGEMTAIPLLADVKSSLRAGAPEVQVVYDRDLLARYELNIQQVASLVRDKVKGNEATRYNMKDRRIPILVRLEMDDRESVENIRSMNINPGADRPIRLDAVAQVRLGEGPSEVRRIDGQRVAVVSANLADGSLSAATLAIERSLDRMDWPSDMTYFVAGQNEEWQNSQRSLLVALALSIFLVYVIMAAQFESLIHPLVIMFTIPLAFVGTILTIKALSISLSIVVFLGMIMLAGIVVNNAIVLVDYINKLRARGIERDEAIVQAGSVRLRPILMTTATTVLGLLPMALGFGDGAEIRTPMAVAVISGLISSTVLTLIVIPSFYRIADSLAGGLFGRERDVAAPDDAATAASR